MSEHAEDQPGVVGAVSPEADLGIDDPDEVQREVRRARALGSDGAIVAHDGRRGQVTFRDQRPVSIRWTS